MAVMRVALLYVPLEDEEVGAVVQAILHEYIPSAFLVQSSAVADQRNLVAETVRRTCDEQDVDLLITLGGIQIAPGFSSEECVPLAMADVVERELPGLEEAMRAYAQEEEPLSLLFNTHVAIRGRTLIVNLPSDVKLAPLFLEAIADLLEPVVQRLKTDQPQSPIHETTEAPPSEETDPTAASDVPSSRGSLDEEEFAAFLANRRISSD